MPNLSSYKKMLNRSGSTVGKTFKSKSDLIMEATWDNDLEARECYIYDYFHDDQPYLSQGMSYDNTTKTKISLKFIATQSSSLSKDEIDFQIQFKPSQPVRFNKDDELYYYETDYRQKFYAQFPIGMYVDIYDDNDDMYHKWLIVAKEDGNQFIKYHVLKCNYYYHWIEVNGGQRLKRKMWGVRRSQSS